MILELVLIAAVTFPSHYCPDPDFQNRPFNRAANVADKALLDMYVKCIRGYMKQGQDAIDSGDYNNKQVVRKMKKAVEDAERIRREYDRGL